MTEPSGQTGPAAGWDCHVHVVDDRALPIVLDHLGGLHADLPASDPAWAAMRARADRGSWLKLSGWYRLRDHQPYSRLHA